MTRWVGASPSPVLNISVQTSNKQLDRKKKAFRAAQELGLGLNLIVTPEFLRRVTTDVPELQVYAYRVDRGLSPADVLTKAPGQDWDRERGLDDHDYIVPGAGGLGEVLNNALR
mgnify:CR=1 FL=1